MPHGLGGEIDQRRGPQRRDRSPLGAGVAVTGGAQGPVDAGAERRFEQVGVVGGEVSVDA